MEKEKSGALDLGMIIKSSLRHWKAYLLTMPIAIAIAVGFVLSIPRYYKCEIMLAPEATDGKSGLNSLMSTFGLGGPENNTDDAISPNLYPDLMESREFVVSMFDVQVQTQDGKIRTTYYDYIKNHQKHPWWSDVTQKVSEWISPKEEKVSAPPPTAFMMSKDQSEVAEAIGGKLKYNYDKKTGVISISVTDQNPLVCALVADTASQRLQGFITEYRTKKAKKDLLFAEKVCKEAKQAYEEASLKYANAVDANWDLVDETTKVQHKSMENDVSLKYQTYSALNQKLQSARIKVVENTPVFTLVQGPSVPNRPAGPKRMLVIIVVTVITFIITTAWAVVKDSE